MKMMKGATSLSVMSAVLACCVFVEQAGATGEGVDMAHITALAKAIDRRASFAASLGLQHTDTQQQQQTPLIQQTSMKGTHAAHATSATEKKSRPQDTLRHPRITPSRQHDHGNNVFRSAVPEPRDTEAHVHKKEAKPVHDLSSACDTPPCVLQGSDGSQHSNNDHITSSTSSQKSDVSRDSGGQPAESRTSDVEPHHSKRSHSLVFATETVDNVEDSNHKASHLKQTRVDNIKAYRSEPLHPWVVPVTKHITAKKLSKLESDLHERSLSEPENMHYHDDLLIRRLKTARLENKSRRKNGGASHVSAESDNWEEELRQRQDLAARAIEHGLQLKKERLAHPDPNLEVSILQRIQQEAADILQRRTDELNFARRTLREKSSVRGVASSSGRKHKR